MKLINTPVMEATFLERPNRFVVRCLVSGKEVYAYLPNPGRLWELLHRGASIRVTPSPPGTKLGYTVLAVQKDGVLVPLHTNLTNTITERLLRERAIPGFEEYQIVKREAKFGRSRFDFLLTRRGSPMVLEVKNCTLFWNDIASFPDAVTSRGSRHVEHLAELSGGGDDAGILFVVQWNRARYFVPDYHTDLAFSRTLLAHHGELRVDAVALAWNADLSLELPVKQLHIPWDLIGENVHDQGCYIVILKVPRDTEIGVGELGNRLFRKGYYLYVGSARKNLTKRIGRHMRPTRKLHWHIDYLRERSSFHKALPVRSPLDLECELAAAVSRLAGWSVKGFGSSDCRCETHLFGMREDPLTLPAFIDLLYDFRYKHPGDRLAHERH